MREGMERGEDQQSPAPDQQPITSQVHAMALWIPYLDVTSSLPTNARWKMSHDPKEPQDRARGGFDPVAILDPSKGIMGSNVRFAPPRKRRSPMIFLTR